ncbi:hypothetical protein HanXRQr2_Chr05g0225571 [Helianthus annuus]|uniref:Uncharacterized protein n=1 Tax=Helianthus annuus TaxID=4232 RepID=A0A251US75_HELAN|nr:hypothetical protein HanXRQr2_Chr05g0225571 [Helianthus annuus]KAJ0923576.1 hypothetical protein HanPSC8_Chr05g0217591 [Helianthus annuus]
MQQTNRPWMQIATQPAIIIPTKPMLVPPMIHRSYLSGKNKQKRRQRPEFINPHALLQLHPFFYLCRIFPSPPPAQVHDHHSGVEITRFPVRESGRKRRT